MQKEGILRDLGGDKGSTLSLNFKPHIFFLNGKDNELTQLEFDILYLISQSVTDAKAIVIQLRLKGHSISLSKVNNCLISIYRKLEVNTVNSENKKIKALLVADQVGLITLLPHSP